MELFELKQGIDVFCIRAPSFPEGVTHPHKSLHALISYSKKRTYFGISYPNPEEGIIHLAAANELKIGELRAHGLEEFRIEKGTYISITSYNFMERIPKIGEAFNKLMAHPQIDPNGFCLEWYLNENDCRCMIKSK